MPVTDLIAIIGLGALFGPGLLPALGKVGKAWNHAWDVHNEDQRLELQTRRAEFNREEELKDIAHREKLAKAEGQAIQSETNLAQMKAFMQHRLDEANAQLALPVSERNMGKVNANSNVRSAGVDI